jgi:hypothetical protein
MDPLTIALIGSVAAPVVGGLIGADQAGRARDDANAARQRALAEFAGISVPDAERQRVSMELMQYLGDYNPQTETALAMGPTGMEQVSLDPRLRAAQMSALEQMSGLASGEIKPGDMAAFELARRNAAQESEAKQQQILQEMQARGQGGSGAELIARLTASQRGADRLQQAQLEEAKAMQQARMQALAQQASMAGQTRGQEYGEQSDLARARDAIAQFNLANQQNVGQRNVAGVNQAQLRNLETKQNIAGQNVGLRNQEQMYNKNLAQQEFQNRMNLAAGRSGQYQGMANAADQAAAGAAAMWAGIGQGVGTGLGAYGASKAKTTNPSTQVQGTTMAGGSYFDPSDIG